MQQNIGNRRFPYERLSKLYLTKKALQDFEKILSPSLSSHSFPPRPIAPERLPTLGDLGIDLCYHIESGGPDLSDLRGYPEMDYAPSSHQSHEQSDGKSGEKSKKKSTIYDSNFEQILVDTGSFASWNSPVPVPKPRNWDDLREILAQDPAECTQLEYEDFVHKSLAARGETKMITSLFPMILGNDDIPYEQDKVFTNLAPFTDGIADARPDLFDGSFPTDVGIDVRRKLSQLIVPSKQSGIPILPNFFLEAKGPEGTTVVAKRQVLYDGTLGARGIHSIQCYGREPFFDNNAYTFSATLHDGVLRIYTTHPACPQGSTVYYTVQIQAYLLDEDLDSFQRGLTALRNARRFSKSQREK